MKAAWIAGVLGAAMLSAPSYGQLSVYLGSTPPPLRYERRPPLPGPGYVWVDGYWGNDGRRYKWVHGHWEQPPYAGAYWSHPHYDHYQQGWKQHEGRWDREDHGDRRDDGDDRHNRQDNYGQNSYGQNDRGQNSYGQNDRGQNNRGQDNQHQNNQRPDHRPDQQ